MFVYEYQYLKLLIRRFKTYIFLCLGLLVLPETISMFLAGNYVTFLKDFSLVIVFGVIGYLYLLSEER